MSLPDPFLPEHMREGLELYLEHGVEPGSFMMSVLTNDLLGAISRADQINQRYLPQIVSYCVCEVPSIAWGSQERVKNWMKQQRLHRVEDANESE